jgi:hypothetical protein
MNGPMNGRTVPQKINDFLVRRPGRTFCDTCIQERLGLKWRQQVQLITATLAVTEAFKRDLGPCCTCSEVKQVIQVVAARPGGERTCPRPLVSLLKPPAEVPAADEC